MKVLLGYFVATLIGLSASQSLMSLLQNMHGGPPRRVQLRRGRGFDLGGLFQRHNLVPSTRSRAQASASSSVGLAGGLAGIRLNDLLGGSGLLAGHVGIQPQTLPNIAVRRSSQVVRPRRTFVLGQGLQTLPRNVAVPSQIATSGIPSRGVGTTMLFDTPDPNTPDAPDLVYVPRSIMGDLSRIEAIRNNAEADGVVFV